MFGMTPYEMYVFALCFIVFFIFTVLFSVVLGYLVSLNLKLIKHGALDVKIKTEYQKKAAKKHPAFGVFLDRFVSISLCIVMCTIFAFSVYMKLDEDNAPKDLPSLKVVQSASMSSKHENNTYLVGIDNQVQTFDLVKTYPIPDASELKLYDVVMYELNGDVILHRIVKIEEPNQYHPNDYWFTLQGDAVPYPDTNVVKHSQMLGIYRGERTPFIGSFVMFMQSPAGYLCILLILIAMIAAPLMERSLQKAKDDRMEIVLKGYGLRMKRAEAYRTLIELLGKGWLFWGAKLLYWRWLGKSFEK